MLVINWKHWRTTLCGGNQMWACSRYPLKALGQLTSQVVKVEEMRLGCLDQTPSWQQILDLACECVWWYPDLDLLHDGNSPLVALWMELGHYSSCVRDSGCGSRKNVPPSNPLKDLPFKTLGTDASLKICFLLHIIIDDELSVISHSFYPFFSKNFKLFHMIRTEFTLLYPQTSKFTTSFDLNKTYLYIYDIINNWLIYITLDVMYIFNPQFLPFLIHQISSEKSPV